MTTTQLQDCMQCLNRNKGIVGKENICNLKGKALEFEGKCVDFDQDKSKVLDKELLPDLVKSNSQRAKNSQILIWILMGLSIASIVSSFLQLNILQTVQNGEFVSNQSLESNDTRVGLLALLYLIAYIISIITFIQWFRRAYYNMNLRVECEDSEGWAAGSWFIPIVSLYKPYKIMSEMSSKASEILKKNSINNINDNHKTLIIVWWTLWIIANYIGKYVSRTMFKADTIETLIESTKAEIISSAIDIPLAIITIFMIKGYAKKEEQLFVLDKNNITE